MRPKRQPAIGTLDLAQHKFEDQRVKRLLIEFKMPEAVKELLDCAEEEIGHRWLTIDIFNRAFPTFPVLLGARWCGGMTKISTPANIFRRFGELFFIAEYLGFFSEAEAAAAGRPIGLVIPFGGFRNGMVIHNGLFATRGTKLIHDIANDHAPHRLTVEPYDRLLKFLASGNWNPDDRRGRTGDQTQPSRKPTSMSIDVGTIRTVGAGPALLVLAWLKRVMNSESGYDRLFVRRIDGDSRLVEASHQMIAFETGISATQVKRGLARLRDLDIVLSRRSENKTLLQLMT